MQKFNWGDGSLTYKHDDPAKVDAFAEYLEREAREQGLEPQQLSAKKGDVFLWHSALVHRGAPVLKPGTTRRSIVTHYSSASAYSADQRAPGQAPMAQKLNGGMYYECPFPGHVEKFYPYNDLKTKGAVPKPNLWQRIAGKK